MISILLGKEGLAAPIAVCDKCGEPIRDAQSGMVLYKRRNNEGTVVDAVFLHKGRCDRTYAAGERMGEGWQELSHFLFRLCHNVGIGAREFGQAGKEAGILEGLDEPRQ